MRRYLYLYFTLVAVNPAAFAQTTPQDQSGIAGIAPTTGAGPAATPSAPRI